MSSVDTLKLAAYKEPMELQRAQASLRAAHLCLAESLCDSAANRAYFAAFQAAVWAIES